MTMGISAKAGRGHAARAARTTARAIGNATRTGEMALAAAQVIDRRSRLIGEAMADPARLSHPELTTMATEKVDAAIAAGNAMSRSLPAIARASQVWLSRQQQLLMEAALSTTRLRSPLDVIQLWQRLASRSLEASLAAAHAAAHVGTRAAGDGLAPIHRTATRNAKRLNGKG